MLSIITPVWNQGEEVKNNFLDLVGVLNRIKDEHEIIFIDDGSSDDSFHKLQGIQDNHPNIKIIRQRHLGQHAALFEGFKTAKGDIIITIDADQSIGSKYIPEFLDKLNQGYEIVAAWKAQRLGLSLIRRAGSWLINRYTNVITRKKIHEHACSLKAYNGQLIKSNLHRKELSRFFGILIAKYADAVTEIKVSCDKESTKNSSYTFIGSLSLLLDFLFTSLTMWYKPIKK